MGEKEALQNAADEARKVARAAREFSRFLDDYAKYLTQPAWQERAVEMHVAALNKLGAINAGLIVCSTWVAESAKNAVAQRAEEERAKEVSEEKEVEEPAQPRGVRIKKKGNLN